MKRLFLALACLSSSYVHSIEYEVQLENDFVSVARVKLMPGEEVGLHRDAYPRVVFALQGGVITRLETDGSTNDVYFPTGQSVFLEKDPVDQLHKGVNSSSTPIELIIMQIKE